MITDMKHITITIYFALSIGILSYIGVDKITLATEALLFLLLQYFYATATIVAAKPSKVVQMCPDCELMTPQHYLHCQECKKCMPADTTHYDILGTCTDEMRYGKYIFMVRLIAYSKIVLYTVVATLMYPWMVVFVLPHVLILKSTYPVAKEDIYVRVS